MAPILGGRRDCGCADCPPPGDCPDGEECLPDNFIDPADCPPAECPDGEECLPSNFIDPADCPPGGCDVTDPSTIDGLIGWYDADDAATFTFTSGVEVDEWADKSGNGNDLITTNAFGGNPSRNAGVLNGRATVFSGGSFTVDSGSMAAAQVLGEPFQVFGVAEWQGPVGPAQTLVCGVGGDTWEIFRSGDGDMTVVANGGGSEISGAQLVDGPHLISVAFGDADPDVVRLDGVEVFSGSLGVAGQNAIQFFQNQGGGRGLDGYLAEWLTFDRVLTEEETACVEAYLFTKWLTGGRECDYLPYCLNENAEDVDLVVDATTPWGYWKLDDASGAPQDSSGNARHGAVGFGTPVYAQAAISAKTGDSIALDGTVRLTFPSPVNLGHHASVMTMAGLFQFTGTGIDGVSGHSAWRLFMGGSATNSYDFGFFDNTLGVNTVPTDGVWNGLKGPNQVSLQGARPQVDTTYPGDDPHFIVLVAALDSMEVWDNGVVIAQGLRDSSLGGTPDLAVGRDDSDFWGSPALRASNVIAWDRVLDPSEIKALTESVLDAAIIASAWRPQG